MSSKSAIYQIKNTVNGKVYVGSACDLKRRWAGHRLDLAAGKHRNQKLQRAWDKYGAEAFEFSVIEYVACVADLIEREQHWIDAMDVKASGYNIAPKAGSQLGFRHSAESKKRMAEMQTGKKLSAETIAKMSAAQKGKPKSPEHAAKVGAAHRGKVISDEARRRISEAQRGQKRGPCSDDTKAKISARLTGRKTGPWSPETRAAHAAAVKPWSHSQEAREKIRAAHLGKVVPVEVRAKMAASAKARPPASAETRAKLSASLTGREVTQETRDKIAAAHRGRINGPMTEEAKAHRSALMRGKKWTAEQVAKRNATKAQRREELGPQYGVRRA